MIRLPTQHEPDDRQASHGADSGAIIIAAALIMRLGQDRASDCGTGTGSNSGAYYPPFAAVSSCDANVTHVCPRDGLAVHHFEQVIPYQSEFAEAAERHTFASLGRNLQPVFSHLVDELITRKVIHEGPRLATVP